MTYEKGGRYERASALEKGCPVDSASKRPDESVAS